jgi:hypothetical protein
MKCEQSIEELLNPAIMRNILISSSLFIAAFESLKDLIISHLKGFYCIGELDDSKPCDDYKKEVLSKNKSALYASLEWFKENQAINEDDLAKFERIKACRNDLSHRLHSLLGSRGLPQDFEIRFHELFELQHKIELWWVLNIEVPISGDFVDQEIDASDVQLGSIMWLQMLIDIALGDEDVANSYYQAYCKRTANKVEEPIKNPQADS